MNRRRTISLLEFIWNIWNTHRWILLLCFLFLVIVLVYIYTHQEEYQSLYPSHILLEKKYKRGGKKNERECRRVVEEIFNDYFPTVRLDAFKNPKTGKNLELDMFNKNHKLALEYQGMQHRAYTPFYHKSEKDFFAQMERDEFKKQRCRELGIDLICVPDTVRFEEIESYIIQELKRLGKI